MGKAVLSAIMFVTFLAISGCGQSPGHFALPDEPQSETEALLTDGPGDDIVNPPISTNPNPPQPRESVLGKYKHLDPNHKISAELLEAAVLYYDANLANITNQDYLAIIDFSKKSSVGRFFIIAMKSGDVWSIHTAHGSGSDNDNDGYAEKFSNVSGSNASSLGFYRTAETYEGSHGNSMRLDGLSLTNSNARERAIVLHGASYVQEASVIQGRSWGCPAVADHLKDQVIDKLKGGSIIYAGLSQDAGDAH